LLLIWYATPMRGPNAYGYVVAFPEAARAHGGVVAIDGLKIEPLSERLLGQPVEDFDRAFGKPLDERITSGFGGVSEYGITVRWDKSFLDVLHLNLARRPHFKLYGGTRFGGTITVDDAFGRYGFHHVALAAGAGKPTVIGLKNNLIRGVRKASDFLMALQLTGAARRDSLANMQLRLPAVVVGGGLTAIDTATESLAYYPVQVEKFLARYEALTVEQGRAAAGATWASESARRMARIAWRPISMRFAVGSFSALDVSNPNRLSDVTSMVARWFWSMAPNPSSIGSGCTPGGVRLYASVLPAGLRARRLAGMNVAQGIGMMVVASVGPWALSIATSLIALEGLPKASFRPSGVMARWESRPSFSICRSASRTATRPRTRSPSSSPTPR